MFPKYPLWIRIEICGNSKTICALYYDFHKMLGTNLTNLFFRVFMLNLMKFSWKTLILQWNGLSCFQTICTKQLQRNGKTNEYPEQPRLVWVSTDFSLIKRRAVEGSRGGCVERVRQGGSMRRFRRRLGAATRSQLTVGNATLNLFHHSNCFRLISRFQIYHFEYYRSSKICFQRHGKPAV